MFALFDLTASLLVLLGFLIFRWAVIAAPILGTVALLRPASAGFRRLVNAVVAALFNIIIFGTGAAIYLFAVDLIMSTPTLPGWLQVVLVWLCGVVGWLLLRPVPPHHPVRRRASRPWPRSPPEGRRSRALREQREALAAAKPGGTDPSTDAGRPAPAAAGRAPGRDAAAAAHARPPIRAAPTDPPPRRRYRAGACRCRPASGWTEPSDAGRAALRALPAGPAARTGAPVPEPSERGVRAEARREP